MDVQFSPNTIEALVQVISGGIGNASNQIPIGIYRSGPKLESFMRACNVPMKIGSFSRLPILAAAIEKANEDQNHKSLKAIAELAADPRDFFDNPSKHQEVLDYLNARLEYDGYVLENHSGRIQLKLKNKTSSSANALAAAIVVIDFDTVKADLDRALMSLESDPEDAVTSACSILESVCRSILTELEIPLPAKKDISSLYKAIREPLGLSPKHKNNIREEIADDVLQILGGISTTISGIGALRTHAGDAHGRERGRVKLIDARIARLAVHVASAEALFLIETWQFKFPRKILHQHSPR
ncbi:abortive infection family protein [Paenochrobactrum glaciei]|uniref:Abortive infection protein-like C-terminal domain-containing protein n=1 Tax=Paenochrobactrum glaciei TaxID=486407 RepID=A0ABP3QNI6_9HYPH